ncbi:MAG: oligopeptide transporter, OPT family [Thermoplasmata archaeon]|nr:MAG: oligopeptide transporter, OPT family [Thermoplasmata archaeon]
MRSREDFESFIPADKDIPELTIRAILIGVFLAILLGAANAYLGLYAGMTVSAIIPGAVMALAFLRPFRGTILEVNIATMGASAGECIAAGAIFTIPALVILKVWSDINYIQTSLIALLGGILGVLWMVPLRRALVTKTELPFPEGIAVAAVLTSTVGGERISKRKEKTGIVYLLIGAILAGLYKFGESALNLFSGIFEYIGSIGKYNIGGKLREGYIYTGISTSPALLGVGWIIGFRIASYVLVGGLLGWVMITPLLVLVQGLPIPSEEYASMGPLLGGFYTIWAEQVRYIGVGAMLVGGLWAIWRIRNNLVDSVKEAVIGLKEGKAEKRKRTERDLSYKLVFVSIVLMVIPIFLLYTWLSGTIGISLVMAIVTIIFAFLASALAGYLTGLVGSSNCPISGVTVTVLLIVSLMMLCFGATGPAGMAIVVFISAVICMGGSISGDLLQAMASGRMLGATPRRLEIAMTIGVIAISAVIGLVIGVLHDAFTIGSSALPAPQAYLMASVVKSVLGGEMLWPYVLSGVILGVIMILLDVPILPIAIGIYLPFTISVPIFAGGCIRYFTDSFLKKKYGSAEEEEISDWELAIKKTELKPQEKAIRTGLLLTSGLVTGEALTGVISALLIISGTNLSLFKTPPVLPGILLWIYIAILLAYIPMREGINHYNKK